MNKTFTSAILASVASAALSVSGTTVLAEDALHHAAPEFRPYVSVFGGASVGESVYTVFQRVPDSSLQRMDLEHSLVFGGAAGVKWNDLLRAEVEVSHSQWSAKNITMFGAPLPFSTPSAGYAMAGTISATYLLGNLWVDVKNNSAFTPYFGAGAGVAFVNTSGLVKTSQGFLGNYVSPLADTAQTRLAWQVGAGMKYDFSNHVALDVGYRFKSIEGLQFENNGFFAPNPLINGNLRSHNIEAGLTLTF